MEQYKTLDELETEWAEQDRRHQARPVVVRRSIDAWHWTRRAWYNVRMPPPWMRVKWNWQRMRRGWSDRDVWSLDSYIAGVLSGAVLKLAEGHAYPGEGTEWDTPEKWKTHLKNLSVRLGMWNDETFHDDESYEITRAAVEEFGKFLGVYWDLWHSSATSASSTPIGITQLMALVRTRAAAASTGKRNE